MVVKFIAENHKYYSLEPDDISWLSVTSFISNFKQPFDADAIALKSSRSKKSKWYGLTPDQIKEAWKNEANRATSLGTWYHNCREKDLSELKTIEVHGVELPVINPIEKDGVKYSPNQKLANGIYPEHFVYLKSAGICGQSDKVEVINNEVYVTDYKTNKEIKLEGYTNWEGVSQKMFAPVSHLDDCHLNHYALQLSMYMFMILKHNPRLVFGGMTIHHVLFEEVGKDKYGNPITALDSNGDPIVKDIVQYDIPYLKKEVISLIHWLQDNRHKLKKV
jgi:hypothetical protein